MIGRGKSDGMTYALFAALLAGTAPIAAPAEHTVSAPVADEATTRDILVTSATLTRRATWSCAPAPLRSQPISQSRQTLDPAIESAYS